MICSCLLQVRRLHPRSSSETPDVGFCWLDESYVQEMLSDEITGVIKKLESSVTATDEFVENRMKSQDEVKVESDSSQSRFSTKH